MDFAANSKQTWKAGNMLYPLPTVMISSADGAGRSNIFTAAWAGTVCTNPAMVSISIRPERYSYDLIRESGEFVINLTTVELTRAMDYCGVRSGRDVDKWKECGLTPMACEHVQAPQIAESPVSIECQVQQVLELGSHHMFVAKVMGVNVDENLLNEKGSLDLKKADLVVYSHGLYQSLGEVIGTFGYSVRKQASQQKGRAAKDAGRMAEKTRERTEAWKQKTTDNSEKYRGNEKNRTRKAADKADKKSGRSGEKVGNKSFGSVKKKSGAGKSRQKTVKKRP